MYEDVTPIYQLGEAFNFDGRDLMANREHRLSVKQRSRLLRTFWSTLGTGALLVALPGIITLAVLNWAEFDLGSTIFSLEAIIAYGASLVLGVFYLVANFSNVLLIFDVMSGQVRHITGPIQRRGVYVRIGRQKFILEDVTLDLIQTGLRYTFYYAPRSKAIVSVEFAE